MHNKNKVYRRYCEDNISKNQYRYEPHKDVWVNDGPPIRRWSRKIIILYYIILYYIILYYIILCCVMLYYIILYYIVLLYYIILYYIILCYIILYYIILYYIILYYIILYYIILYCNTIVLKLPTVFSTVTCCTVCSLGAIGYKI